MRQIIPLLFSVVILSSCGDDTDYTVIGSQGTLKAIAVPTALVTDRDHYLRIVARVCPSSGLCILSFFVGLSSVSYPLSDIALTAQTAQYNRNPNSGLNRLLLACRLEDFSPDDCF